MSTDIRPELSRKSQYWLPKERYYELKHFCLQYPDWQKSYISLDGLPTHSPSLTEYISGGEIPDPTAVYAESRLYFREWMEMIEAAAHKAAGDLDELLVRAVTHGVSYEHISPPCCKEVWYAAYRRFFWLLDKARK